MAHFVYPVGTPLGTVPTNYVLPEADWETNIEQVFKAINGDDGGTWAPGAFITVGGAGFEFTGTGHSLAAGARLTAENGAEVRLQNGAYLVANGSAGDIRLEVAVNVATLTIQNGAYMAVNSGGSVDFAGACVWKTSGPGSATFESGTTLTLSSGATLTAATGSTVNLTGSTLVRGTLTIRNSGGPGSFVTEAGTTFTANSAATFNDAVTVNASVTCTTLAVTGNATVGGTLGVTGNTTLGAACTITGNATLGGTCAVTGNTTVGGTLGVTGAATLSAATTIGGLFKRSGTSAYEELRYGNGPDASTTVTLTDYDVWNPAITADRTWTLDNGPSGKAVRAVIVAPPAPRVLSVAGVGVAFDMDDVLSSGNYEIVELMWVNSKWYILAGTLS